MDRLGRTGVPIINVEAACASSGSALYLGAQMVEAGTANVVLCLGVEKAPRGFIAGSGLRGVADRRPVSASTRCTSRCRPRS